MKDDFYDDDDLIQDTMWMSACFHSLVDDPVK